MKVTFPVLCVLSFAVGVATSFAGDGNTADDKGNPVPKAPLQTISWDEFQARCRNPLQFPAQVPPTSITLHCKSIETGFVPEAPGVFAADTTRRVQATVSSNQWSVGDDQQIVSFPGIRTPEGCPRYKEIEIATAHDIELSCDDILGIKGSIQDYCADVTTDVKGKNPKEVSIRETGRVIDTCKGLPEIAGHDRKSGGKHDGGHDGDHGDKGGSDKK